MASETRYLQVNGAKLCFDVVGSDPHILFVAVLMVMLESSIPIREQLNTHLTVVTYDRRGVSRSELTDTWLLILTLFQEPSFMNLPSWLCPEKQEYFQFQYDTYEVYNTEGKYAAMAEFADFYCNEADKRLMKYSQGNSDPQRSQNSAYWFEYELRRYPTTEFDWEMVKVCGKDKLIPVCGDDSKGEFIYKPNTLLAQLTGTEIFEIPGGHLGFLTVAQPSAGKAEERTYHLSSSSCSINYNHEISFLNY